MQNRRNLLKIGVGTVAGLAFGLGNQAVSAQENTIPGIDTRWAELLGWKVGCQLYSFNRFTFEEAVKKNVLTGARYCEAFPGQKLTAEGGSISPNMSKEEKQTFSRILAENGCVCTTIGVTGATREMFDFCSEMRIGVINAEPKFRDLPEIDKMCQEYNIKVSLHNHPKPSIYWDFNLLLHRIKDLSPMIGACADTGHYMRSGIQPLDAIKALKGHIIGLHLKDLNEFDNKSAHDVPWGKGLANMSAILYELADQKFQGAFSAEYEYNWDNSVPEIAESIKFFNNVAKEILTA